MTRYSPESQIAVTDVRVSEFRSLASVEVILNDLTVLVGANNSGKTTFLDAMFGAIGAGRKHFGQDDIRLAADEAFAPKERKAIIDIRIRPVGQDGAVLDSFPVGSFWTQLWGRGIAIDPISSTEYAPIRTVLAWNPIKKEYGLTRYFLKEWRGFEEDWISTAVQASQVGAAQVEPIALHIVDAKRDLDEDLRKQGSFWRRLTSDLGLSDADVADLELALSGVNQAIVEKSRILQHLRTSLLDLQRVVFADSGGVEIGPVARQLRDLSKGMDVSFSTSGSQSFPLVRHGMGTRSLAALLVFRAFASWQQLQAIESSTRVHSVLALEEPESHLHPHAQRSLFRHIKDIVGQRIVSTHSPYFAGQAQLEDIRLFIKRSGDTVVSKLELGRLPNANHRRKIQEAVIESRGDILFATALVLFEGQTEEQALPIWAQEYWGASIHELGFSFARVNGTDYLPFIWLAKNLQIPWYLMSDGEAQPLQNLNSALSSAGLPDAASCPNVITLPHGNNFERQLVSEGYLKEIEAALDEAEEASGFLDRFIHLNDGRSYGKRRDGIDKGVRSYSGEGGRERAAVDAMTKSKTRLAKPLARHISGIEDRTRKFPAPIASLFTVISAAHGLPGPAGELS